MAIGGGMSCVKYLLFAFNLLFAITGLVILIVGIKAEIKASPYVDLTDSKFYSSASIVMILVGIIVFIVAFFGCCGAVKENHCMIVTFSVFLVIIFIAELAVGIAGYMNPKDLQTTIRNHLNETINDYPTDKTVQDTFDIIQTDLKCCGIDGPADWAAHNLSIPLSCCHGLPVTDGKPDKVCPVNDAYKDGCLNFVVSHLHDLAKLLGGVGLGIAIVQLLGIIFACCLARSIRSQYETV